MVFSGTPSQKVLKDPICTIVCKTSETGFRVIYSPYRQAILLKNFTSKLYSAENFSTKLGIPRLKRLPTD
jgi:hypothetical protein